MDDEIFLFLDGACWFQSLLNVKQNLINGFGLTYYSVCYQKGKKTVKMAILLVSGFLIQN